MMDDKLKQISFSLHLTITTCTYGHCCGIQDWEILSFLKSLRAALRVSNAVAMITCPTSLLTPFFCTRWQHLVDIVLSVKAIPGKLLQFIAVASFSPLLRC